MGPAGVVHDDVDAAERGERRLRHGRPVGGDRDVGADRLGRAAALADGRCDPLGTGGVDVVHHHARALLGQPHGDALTEPGPGTGDDRYFVFEPHRASSLVSPCARDYPAGRKRRSNAARI